MSIYSDENVPDKLVLLSDKIEKLQKQYDEYPNDRELN